MKILIALAGIVGVLVAIVATRPAEFRVARTATMAAPPSAVFAQVNDFHKWGAFLKPFAATSLAEFSFEPAAIRPS